MISFDIGISFFLSSITNLIAWDIGVIYLTAVALAGLIGSIFCEWCWRWDGLPPDRIGVPSNA